MRLWNTVKFAHVALGLVPEVLDPVDVVLRVCEQLGMVDAQVLERAYIQRIIALPTVRVDNAIGDDLTLNDRHQGAAFGVGYHPSVDLAAALKQAKNRNFPRSTPPALALATTTKIALIYFDLAAEHGFSSVMQP